MIFDSIDNFDSYFTSDTCVKLINHIKELTSDSDVGKTYVIDDDLIINIDVYSTKELSNCVLETHEKYVDIQLLLSGEEYIDIYPSENLEVKDEYDNNRDVAFYHVPDVDPVRVKLVPGNFTVLFPQDAHSPQIKVLESCDVKKVVVKIIPKLLK